MGICIQNVTHDQIEFTVIWNHSKLDILASAPKCTEYYLFYLTSPVEAFSYGWHAVVAKCLIITLLPCVHSTHHTELNPNMKSHLIDWCAPSSREYSREHKCLADPTMLSLLQQLNRTCVSFISHPVCESVRAHTRGVFFGLSRCAHLLLRFRPLIYVWRCLYECVCFPATAAVVRLLI